MILRQSGDIKYEKEWECWSELSNQQMIRPAHPCRINITVFAKNFEPEITPGQSSAHPTPTINRKTVDLDDPMPANPDAVSLQPTHPSPQDGEVHSPRVTTIPDSEKHEQSTHREVCKHDQGTYFHALPKWEQNQLIQIHKNLGHPSNERLAKALQSNGQRPEMVKAALELKCGICAASSAPKHQRPGRLKPLLDFNHRIYVDGIKWTNKKFSLVSCRRCWDTFSCCLHCPSTLDQRCDCLAESALAELGRSSTGDES